MRHTAGSIAETRNLHAMSRLEVMVGMGNANMGVRAIRQQISAALDLSLIHISLYRAASFPCPWCKAAPMLAR